MDPVGVGVVIEVAVEADHPWVDEGVDRPWAEVAHQWEAVVAASGQVVEAPDVADPCEVDLAETEVTEERDHTRSGLCSSFDPLLAAFVALLCLLICIKFLHPVH